MFYETDMHEKQQENDPGNLQLEKTLENLNDYGDKLTGLLEKKCCGTRNR